MKTEELAEIARFFKEGCSVDDIARMYRISYADADQYRMRLKRQPKASMKISRPMKDALKSAAVRRGLSPEQLAEQLIRTVFEDRLVPAVLNDPPGRGAGVHKVPSYLRLVAEKEAHNRGMNPRLLVSQLLERIVLHDLVERILDDTGEQHESD